MSRENLENIKKRSFVSILLKTVCILLVLTVLIALAVSEAYAKYVSSDGDNGSSKVANEGVDLFELKEHKAVTDDIDYMVEHNVLHKLTDTEVKGSVGNYIVPPGVDIPKDPFIRLRINSEVSYELYVKVTCKFPPTDKDGDDDQLVVYYMTDDWELEETDEENGVYTYKYVVNPDDSGASKYVFAAGKSHEYDNGSEIKLLDGDMLYISENYYIDETNTKASLSFSIKFEAYIQQTISV